ncbi:MAG: hypothetical protein LBC89_01790, partial [Bacteroidales bacterium]|jgi:hypothetical protein|nr:hypothetical protein [Bacteroidales bacterium]
LPIQQLIEKAQDYADNNFYRDWLMYLTTYYARISNKHELNLFLANELYKTDYRANNFINREQTLCINDSALSFLIEKCKKERVVMLNENHASSNHRILAAILIDSLAKYGFSYFGAEGISVYDTAIDDRKFAIFKSGYYTRDPMFANMIRTAKQKGYTVFCYDARGKDRDKKQAQNIFDKAFAKDATIKLFVYAGFGHIHEAEGKTKNNMAREFLLLSGINPLTIDQADFFDSINHLSIIDTTNLKNHRMTTDMYVANNISYDWYAEKSGYVSYEISISQNIANQALKESLMFVVSIFREEEYQKDKSAIPVYNYLLDNNSTKIDVKLPKDTYLYLIKNRFGDVIEKGDL